MKRPLEETPFETGDQSIKAEAEAQLGIQRLIHFIWAGGDENMPVSSLDTVTRWSEANPSFDVMIWVDAWDKTNEHLDGTKLDQIFQYYHGKFTSAGVNVFVNDVPPGYQRIAKAPIIIRDITQHQMVNEHVRYEIDKVIPNFGSSSDILRYRILRRLGGMYIDSDVHPGLQSLITCPLFSEDFEDHVLYLDHVSQKISPPPVCFEIFELFHQIALDENAQRTYDPIPGNDSFICTPDNPMMAEIIKLTNDNYQLPQLNKINKCILAAYGDICYMEQTIDRTGTTPVQIALSNSKPRNIGGEYYEMTCGDKKVIVCPLRHTGSMLVQPIRNTKYWIKVIEWQKIDPELTISQLVKQTHQELKFFGVLRLDDHVHFIKELARKKDLNPDQLIAGYLNQLDSSKLPLQEVKVVQLVSLDRNVHQFYAKHQLYQFTQILKESNPACFQQVCDLVTSKIPFNKMVESINQFGAQTIQKIDHKRGEIQKLYHALNVAVDYIELLQSDTKKFARMLGDDCTTCLRQVQTIVMNFEEKFETLEFQFDTSRLERLLENFQLHKKEHDIADAHQILKAMMGANPGEESPPLERKGPESSERGSPDPEKSSKGFK